MSNKQLFLFIVNIWQLLSQQRCLDSIQIYLLRCAFWSVGFIAIKWKFSMKSFFGAVSYADTQHLLFAQFGLGSCQFFERNKSHWRITIIYALPPFLHLVLHIFLELHLDLCRVKNFVIFERKLLIKPYQTK